MKKKIFSLILTGIMSLSLALSSCQYILPKSVVSASLNEKGELILTYSDNTTQNVGVVKGEDGKDGQDGKDGVGGQNSACEHQFSKWETQIEPTCTSIGYDTRTCSSCGNLEFQFTESLGHNYTNAVDIINTYEQHLVSRTCSSCGDTKIEEFAITKHVFEGEWETKEYPCATVKQRPCLYCDTKQTEIIETIDFSAHTFDENTLCTTCGYQEFIQSEEYITVQKEAIANGMGYPYDLYTWISVDGGYGLQIMSNPNNTFISRYVGTPVNVVIPTNIYGKTITSIGGGYGYGGIASAFSNCITLEYIVIPNTINQIFSYAFDNCISLKAISPLKSLTTIRMYAFRSCSSLSMIILPKSLKSMLYKPFEGCNSLERVYYSGSINEWNTISFAYGKTDIKDQYIYYYSESKPTEKGNYWHYINGEPIIWEI